MSVGLSVCPTKLSQGVSRRELKNEMVLRHGASLSYFSVGAWVEKNELLVSVLELLISK